MFTENMSREVSLSQMPLEVRSIIAQYLPDEDNVIMSRTSRTLGPEFLRENAQRQTRRSLLGRPVRNPLPFFIYKVLMSSTVNEFVSFLQDELPTISAESADPDFATKFIANLCKMLDARVEYEHATYTGHIWRYIAEVQQVLRVRIGQEAIDKIVSIHREDLNRIVQSMSRYNRPGSHQASVQACTVAKLIYNTAGLIQALVRGRDGPILYDAERTY